MRIIPDIGSTHGGNKDECLKAIQKCADLGLKDCKFQLLEKHQLSKLPLSNILLPWDWVPDLVKFGKSIDVNVFFSCWSEASIKVCLESSCSTIKFACSTAKALSTDWVAELEKEHGKFEEIIVSEEFYKFCLIDERCVSRTKKLSCIPEYPVLYQVDFSILKGSKGFSDHTLGIEQTKNAIRAGAQIIEKHVSQTNCKCPDNRFAISWDEVKELNDWWKTNEN